MVQKNYTLRSCVSSFFFSSTIIVCRTKQYMRCNFFQIKTPAKAGDFLCRPQRRSFLCQSSVSNRPAAQAAVLLILAAASVTAVIVIPTAAADDDD